VHNSKISESFQLQVEKITSNMNSNGQGLNSSGSERIQTQFADKPPCPADTQMVDESLKDESNATSKQNSQEAVQKAMEALEAQRNQAKDTQI